jgi:hypothetical protein
MQNHGKVAFGRAKVSNLFGGAVCGSTVLVGSRGPGRERG